MVAVLVADAEHIVKGEPGRRGCLGVLADQDGAGAVAGIDGELSRQQRRDRVGAVAPHGLRQEGAVDLRRRQGDTASDATGDGIAYDGRARCPAFQIVPRVTAEPLVQRLPPAIEGVPVIIGSERPGWRQSSMPGV